MAQPICEETHTVTLGFLPCSPPPEGMRTVSMFMGVPRARSASRWKMSFFVPSAASLVWTSLSPASACALPSTFERKALEKAT